MANEENGEGHYDLLTAALSESGLGDLVGFSESEEPKEQPPIQVVTQALPVVQSTPARPGPQYITVRTGPRGQNPAQIIRALPTSQTPVKVISSGDPQAAKNHVATKIIRLTAGGPVLQKSGGGAVAATGQPTSGQHVVVPATTSRIITFTHGANGSSTPVAKNIIVSTVPRTDGSQNHAQHILVGPQGAKTSVHRRILMAQNGPSTSSTVTSMGGQVVLASVTPQQVRTVASPQLLQTASGVQKVLINQGNGRVLQVRQQTPSNSVTGNGALTSQTIRVTSSGLQTRFIHPQSVGSPQTIHTAAALPLPAQTCVIQPSADQLKSISRSKTGSQVIISQSSLSGAKVISASAAPSPGPSTGTLNHSFSMPVLSKEGSRSRSNSPVCGLGNIPTVVTQRTNVRNFPGAGSDSKEVSWTSEEMHLRAISHASTQQRQKNVHQIADDAEEEAEELGHAETYADYKPKKLMFGRSHPDQVVESSSLSSVESPDVHYLLSIPEEVMDQGYLSALQLESIIYACQRHEFILPNGDRAGYLIGDGAGVGKGRTVAGIIHENFLHGRKKALWLSVSNDLKVDAERDLHDIGADNINVYLLNKFKYMAKISSSENGNVKKGVIFGTYSSLIGESNQTSSKYTSRMKQLMRWCGKDFDGVIIFDECHKAKNLCPTGSSKPTKTGKAVMDLQNHLPKARVVYASATGATEPKNMAYMTRLGLWGEGTSFREFSDFISSVEKRGVGAMELVAMDMKLRGMYIARQLSFAGTSFHVEQIPLTKDFHKVYNQAVEVWMEARAMFQKAADLIKADKRMQKSMWGQFWSAHQRFFKYLCISAKVKHCIKLAKEAVNSGKCVVIGLQSTGEARTQEMVEREGDDLNDFVSTAKGVFQSLVEKHFPAADRMKTLDILGWERTPNNGGQNSGFKRKREDEDTEQNKRLKAEEDSSEDNSDVVSDFSDLSDFDSSSTNSDEDTNPFGSGNDSEEDPWVKKSKKKKKKKKGKAPKQKKKGKKKKEMNSDAELDEYCDRKLAQLKKNNARLPCDDGNANDNDPDDQRGMNQALEMKLELLNQVELLGESLPSNTLDILIDGLGGTGKVAEMTGRKSRLVQNEGYVQYETRSETQVAMENLNLLEKERFMEGTKPIAIISDAASSGISLHADRRVGNTSRRVHITLELPWSADRAIQQFGRTHRSNQKSAPEYIFLISDLAGERRFASTVAKRLESLGALTHGDRRATESRDLSRFNIDNRYGRLALEAVMKSVLGQAEPIVDPPTSYTKEQFFEEVKKAMEGVGLISCDRTGFISPDKEYNNISKFLNRLLGMPTELQNALFDYFNNTLSAIIMDAKRSGRWDMGILDLGSGEEVIQRLDTQVFVGNTATNTAKTELSTIQVERGMPWEKALDIWRKCSTMEEGFYLSVQERTFKRTAALVAQQGRNKKKEKVYSLYRPNTGMQSRAETLEEIKKKYKKVMPDDAESWWKEQYDASTTTCTHAYWNGNCKKVASGQICEIGLRTRQYHMLSGSVLSVWGLVESVLNSMPGGNMSKMQIVRLRIGDGKKRDDKKKDDNDKRIVGSLIPSNCVPPLVNVLKNASARTYVETHNQTLQSAINGLRNSAIASTSTSSRFNGSLRNDYPRMETDNSLSEDPSGSSAAPPAPLLSMPTLID